MAPADFFRERIGSAAADGNLLHAEDFTSSVTN